MGEIPEGKLMSMRNYWNWVVGRSTEGKAKCKGESLMSAAPGCACAAALHWGESPCLKHFHICWYTAMWGADSLAVTCNLWHVPTKGAVTSSSWSSPGSAWARSRHGRGDCSIFKDQSGLTAERWQEGAKHHGSMKGFWLGTTEQSPSEKTQRSSFGCLFKREGRASLTSQSGLCFWCHLHFFPWACRGKASVWIPPRKFMFHKYIFL